MILLLKQQLLIKQLRPITPKEKDYRFASERRSAVFRVMNGKKLMPRQMNFLLKPLSGGVTFQRS